MSLRTIMIFPEFANEEMINAIRDKYDPLAGLVRPHITIVFPFEARYSNEEIRKVLEDRLEYIEPFELVLHGFSKCEDSFGNYLFLNVVRGMEPIVNMHELLYHNEFKAFDRGLPYIPHMTVGKLSNSTELNRAYEEIRQIDDKFTTIVKKVSVEMIGEQDESIIVIEKQLG